MQIEQHMTSRAKTIAYHATFCCKSLVTRTIPKTAAKALVMLDLAVFKAEFETGMFKKPMEVMAKEFQYDPLLPKVRTVVIAAWTRGDCCRRRLLSRRRPQRYPELRYPERDHQMPLTFTGESLKTINSTDYRAIGSHGEIVIVEASDEVLQDYGEVAVQQKASAKYDLVEIQNNRVTVKTSDFR